mgnify:CR=1 FL=1
MDNKKLGIVILVISVILSVIIIFLMNNLTTEAQEMGCFENEGCMRIESTLSVTHFIFGFIGFSQKPVEGWFSPSEIRAINNVVVNEHEVMEHFHAC